MAPDLLDLVQSVAISLLGTLQGLLMFPNFKGNDWYVFVFTATDFSGELIDSPEGRVKWIPDETVLDLNFWESDNIFMPWIREGKSFPQSLNMRGDNVPGRYSFSFIKTVISHG